MGNQYIELLLVVKQDDHVVLVAADAHAATVGCVVELVGGGLGRVESKAWAGEKNGDLVALISAVIPIFEAKTIYYPLYEKEADNGTAHSNT